MKSLQTRVTIGLEKTISTLKRYGLFRLSMSFLALWGAVSSPANGESVEWKVTETGSTSPLPCRIHLTDDRHKPVKIPGLPFWRNHFNCDGMVNLDLSPGTYHFEIQRGPEYATVKGDFQVIEDQNSLKLQHRLTRMAHLAEEGWWSGELHIHRPLNEVPLLMQAEDLHIGPVITWWNRHNPWQEVSIPTDLWQEVAPKRFIHIMGGEDERRGGALLYFQLKKPLLIQQAQPEYPSPMVFLNQAAALDAWIDIEKPFWWDVPAWLASGKVDSIGLANNHMWQRGMLDNEAWGRPRSKKDFPSPQGNGRWTQFLYYQILNAGFQLAPSAGSASGVLNNPVGYNRVYVHLKEGLNLKAWWEGLRKGQSFVTNGPLLRCQANNFLPGTRLQVSQEADPPVHLKARLTSRDPVEAFEIIHNGEVLRTVKVTDLSGDILQDLGPAPTGSAGWFLVRAVTSLPHTFRFASTAPFYVLNKEGKIPVQKEACQFFLDWTQERMGVIERSNVKEKEEVLAYWKQTEAFWKKRSDKIEF